MKTKIFFIVLALVLLAGLALTPYIQARAESDQPCTNVTQASKLTIPATSTGTARYQLIAIQFTALYCQPPIVVATGGLNVNKIQISKVTSSTIWLLVYGIPDQEQTIYWQAMVPTQ